MSGGALMTPNNTDSNSSRRFVGYVDDPDGRGTPSLIISCVLTLVLCVWSALHLNVPAKGQTALQKLTLNTRWIIAGIYCPELVVFTAWRQWSSARILQQVVDDSLESQDGKLHSVSRNHQWTMTHSFFACSGGFAFEIDSLKGAIPGPTDAELQRPQRLTITARGMALLAKCGQLPDVEEEEIEDKSKANDLAKATVIMQATWMLIQSLGRLAFQLPVTLLEVNTVAHVLCAFSMYMFWWYKPLLPREPIVLRDQRLAPLAAMMYSSSEMSGYVNAERLKSKTVVKTFFAHLSLYSKVPELETICLQSSNPAKLDGHVPVQEKVPSEGLEIYQLLQDSSITFHESCNSCITEVQRLIEKEKGTAFFERRPRVPDKRPSSEATRNIDEKRWSLMAHALRDHACLSSGRTLLAHTVDKKNCVHLRPEQLVADHIQNWPSNDLLRNVDGLVVGMVLWLANFCYGGIHAAAWNDHFPSVTEKWIWRSCASYIGFCGGLWVLLNFIVSKYPRLNEFWERWMDGEKNWLESFGLGVIVFLCGFSLVFSRMFIVIEAFISIRELTVESYQTPRWTSVFPHL